MGLLGRNLYQWTCSSLCPGTITTSVLPCSAPIACVLVVALQPTYVSFGYFCHSLPISTCCSLWLHVSGEIGIHTVCDDFICHLRHLAEECPPLHTTITPLNITDEINILIAIKFECNLEYTVHKPSQDPRYWVHLSSSPSSTEQLLSSATLPSICLLLYCNYPENSRRRRRSGASLRYWSSIFPLHSRTGQIPCVL